MGRRIRIFDTTLRDGEQTPGVNLNISDKLRIAHVLAGLGVDVIEAGFPASSQDDFVAVRRVSEQIRGPVICALARAEERDIRRAAEALEKAEKSRIHIFIASSDIHLQYKLKMTREQVRARTAASVRLARSLCADVQFSAEDASRSDPAFLCELFETAIENGASTVNIADTVGYAVPDEFAALIRRVMGGTRNLGDTVVSVHCHNDLGMATANSLAALMAGAGQVECTLNGLGERAGNAAAEEIVMALQTRHDLFGLEHGVDTRMFSRASKTVASVTGVYVPQNKPVVGKNAFVHDAGIHQHGVLANPLTYEIMTPQSVGLTGTGLALGKLSGHHAFEEKLSELGLVVDPAVSLAAFNAFKDLACRKKDVSDDDVRALVEEAVYDSHIVDGYELDTFQIQSGNRMQAMALVSLSRKGEKFTETGAGEGPIDASFNAINRIVGQDFKLLLYNIKAVTGGTDALGEVRVRITDAAGHEFPGKGVSTDIIKSSIRAYINAINRSMIQGDTGA